MNQYANLKKMIELAEEAWSAASSNGLTHIRTRYTEGSQLVTETGHEFINMCSCSYLGLDKHPDIIQGAIDALTKEKVMILPTSRTRIGLSLLDETETDLSRLFQAEAIVTLSCAAASSGMLPLIASGALSQQEKPLMIFDRYAHFSMNHLKSGCGDETDILTCPHNDLAWIETELKKANGRPVFYIADGAYSMGGYTPIEALKALQEKYGLYLYFDDSHSISMYGNQGVGFVRSSYDTLHPRTIIVASLGKAFGATGGLVLLGDPKMRRAIEIYGGPLGWSQTANVPALGAIRASVRIHESDELVTLQRQLAGIMNTFDELIPTENALNNLPIRVVDLNDAERAIEASAEIYRRGFYTSAVFFPIVARGRAGLRVMGRADLAHEDIAAFCRAVADFQ
ncbi:aminotransferase class I/II-fold pyridoxal phosphate-dependent enzyme [Photobacterium sp. GJ3]|uniref:aminotransferase class I/II-fold pyridoxal phosphate-dependent enzyme n=1 Tax=Photobacterium sp. GJ3 TaxID=2829502 RepID=UPI001B8B089E|nr:aminotransferase class I/II-fold pyridoxal phosphate-dependent enzyme [Photobacterium sp. GJ3]QUJ68046.1 aminotransferase class I/II-fold pyridoxal phosphate-dependent enzyme [Photobacterium sp. GJ3]